jgi:hypothetical protein
MKPVDWRIDYFREASGRSPVESFIDALSRDEKVDTMVGIDMLRTRNILGPTVGGAAGERTLGVENKDSPATSHPVLSHNRENLCPASCLCEKDP